MNLKLLFPPLALLAAGLAAAGGDDGQREVGRFEGIWKMCYEPGLEQVVEIDSGYLVLMPGGRYYDVSASWELGDYEVEAEGIVLHRRRNDGTPVTVRLRHRPAVRAVFFDDPRGEPVQAEVLAAGESIDYGWCRAYPGPEGFTRARAAPPPTPAPRARRGRPGSRRPR